MSKYLKHGMHLVYLDQCVLSRFLNRPENEQWRALLDTIREGNVRRRLLCPTSLEHLIETSSLPDLDALSLDGVMRQLSYGWALLPELLLVTNQIITRLRGGPVLRTHFMAKHLLRPTTELRILAQLRAMKAGLDEHNADMMAGVNSLNALTRNGRKPSSDMLQYFIQRLTDSRVEKLLGEIVGSLTTGRVVIRSEEKEDKVLNWASKVAYELITRHRLGLAEAQRLCQLLRTERLGFIPTVKIKVELAAMQFHRGENIEPRDQYDITRAACALPYVDVFVTDGGKASAIRELKLDAAYKVEVFSMKKSELNTLTMRLRDIVD